MMFHYGGNRWHGTRCLLNSNRTWSSNPTKSALLFGSAGDVSTYRQPPRRQGPNELRSSGEQAFRTSIDKLTQFVNRRVARIAPPMSVPDVDRGVETLPRCGCGLRGGERGCCVTKDFDSERQR